MVRKNFLNYLMIMLAIIWGMLPVGARAQGCCPSGSGGGHTAGVHAGHQPSPMNLGNSGGHSASQHSVMDGCPMGSCSSSELQRPKAAMDIIKWPKLLQAPAFASEREQFEAPYRRSGTDKGSPTARDYRNMAKTVQDMKAILEWLVSSGANTQDYEQAKDFLNRLGTEVGKRSQVVTSATPLKDQVATPAKSALQVTLASITKDDQAGIARQRVCPVTGTTLGSMGVPIKVLVDNQPLYLCCSGCVANVKASPEKYRPQRDK